MPTISLEWQMPQAKDPKALIGAAFNLFQAHGNQFDARLKTERMSGAPGVNRRSGNLANGWNVQTIATSSGVMTTNWLAGPAAEKDGHHGYGWVQENGKIIVPVKSKFLWIPTKENQTPTGVARISPTEAIAMGGFIHNGVFFGKTVLKTQKPTSMALKGAKGVMGHVFKGREPLVPLFVLKRSVEIPPRLGATALWNTMVPDLEAGIDRVVKENL